jgi:hypothetical protein
VTATEVTVIVEKDARTLRKEKNALITRLLELNPSAQEVNAILSGEKPFPKELS